MARPLSVTAYGNAQISTSQSKFGGSSLYSDGIVDYVTVGSDKYWISALYNSADASTRFLVVKNPT